MEKHIILLNGPSSSGKSTLSKNLQNKIEELYDEKYAIVSIDDFIKISTEETIYEDDVFEISGLMCQNVLELLETSSGVIIDHVITSSRIFKELIEMLGEFKILTVLVSCPLDVLKKRELERKNRCLGSAESSYTYLFPKSGYDITVDTNNTTTEECSRIICEKLMR